MWIFGLILLAAAVGLAFAARSKRRRLRRILNTEVCTIAHLRELARSMAEGLGSGSLRFEAAITGAASCDQPLVSQLAEVDSVYYSTQVLHEKEQPAAGGGSKDQGPQRTNESVTQETKQIDFELEDKTGSLHVASEGARWMGETALSRFEPAGDTIRHLQIGRLLLEMPSGGSGDHRTLGFRFNEEVVPVGQQLYLLGLVTDPDGELRISSPEEGEPLLISVKGREQLIRDMGSGSKGLTIGAVVCGVLGLLLLL